MEFKDHVALITGAGGRLGCPCALAFAREGARLILTDYRKEALERAVSAVRGVGGDAVGLPADVTRPPDVDHVLSEGTRRLGPVDILVNFAGYVPFSYVLDVSADEWDHVFAVNVKGTMLCCQALARQMVERGDRGSIVNISSGASTSGRVGGAHYCGSKAAVNMLTEVLAAELGPHGIRVNAVAPGLVMDDIVHRGDPVPDGYVRDMLAATPLGRTGTPDDIAAAVLFLASDRAQWITGEVLYVTGGSHCGRTHMAPARTLTPARGGRA